MQSRSHMQGYLLKRNRDYRKANLLGIKYKRRWVELTADTLAYASSQQELLTGKIQVFSIKDMLWVRAEAEAKFLIKFKERTLTFKVESENSADRSDWVAALLMCKKQQIEGHTSSSETGDRFDHFRKVAEQQLLNAASPNSSTSGSVQACTSLWPALGSPEHRFSELRTSYGGDSSATTLAYSSGTASQGTTETGVRPLSPRSLLASAKAGSAFVGSNRGADSGQRPAGLHCDGGACSATGITAAGLHGRSVEQQAVEGGVIGLGRESSSSEDGDDPASCKVSSCVPANGVLWANDCKEQANRNAVASLNGMQPEVLCSATSSQPLVGQVTAVPISSPEDSGSQAMGAQARNKRAMLTRRLTPGVMLINTSTLASPVLPASPTSDMAAHGRRIPNTGMLHADLDEVLRLGHIQPETSLDLAKPSRTKSSNMAGSFPHEDTAADAWSVQHSAGNSFDSDEGLCNEILKLDPSMMSSGSNQCSAHAVEYTKQRLDSSRELPTSAAHSRRPESAPHCTLKRPHTALKSCLRHGGSATGSISTPSSNGAIAAAAAAAVATALGASCKPLAAGGRYTPKQQQASNYVEWAQQNWSEPGQGGDAPHIYLHEGPKQQHCLPTDRHVGAANSSLADAAGCAVGVQGGVLGVKADESWLEDDFDS